MATARKKKTAQLASPPRRSGPVQRSLFDEEIEPEHVTEGPVIAYILESIRSTPVPKEAL
jgi:hypothetical protein